MTILNPKCPRCGLLFQVKVCYGCRPKPLSAFSRNRSRSDGLEPICRQCRRKIREKKRTAR